MMKSVVTSMYVNTVATAKRVLIPEFESAVIILAMVSIIGLKNGHEAASSLTSECWITHFTTPAL